MTTYLETQGFQTVLLENLSLNEQAQLFNSVEIVVAAHGAGLSNLVFCNTKLPVTVIEFFPPGWITDCFPLLTEQLSKERGFQFNHICHVTSNKKLSSADAKAQSIYVEVDFLKKTIQSIIAAPQ